MTLQRLLHVVVLSSLILGSPAACAAEKSAGTYPQKPIRWIVPFPPGGSNDMLSRFLGAKLADAVAQQIVIDNRAGANGIIGTELAAHSAPDGYTLLMVSTSFVMNAAVRSLPYDVEKSFDPIATFGSSPNCIVVYPGFGVSTLRELVERARAKPGSIMYASTGVGGFNHFGGELFKKVANVDIVMVPYKGGGPAMVDVMSGQIPAMFSSVTQVLPHVRNGKLKVLAVGASKRTSALPDTPTVAEAGFPGYEVTVWWGVVAPRGTPAPVLNKLHRQFNAIVSDTATRERLAAEAADVMTLKPPEFRQLIHDDVKKWSDIAKRADIRLK
ncbi:MAG TPA: tripartite tricarboxylate transporter substrate binding protein [Burkholderiales bacterium]|nr:tripartite tricarboxylate transporter substrate binding protein [Burkholderiales bacterium]